MNPKTLAVILSATCHKSQTLLIGFSVSPSWCWIGPDRSFKIRPRMYKSEPITFLDGEIPEEQQNFVALTLSVHLPKARTSLRNLEGLLKSNLRTSERCKRRLSQAVDKLSSGIMVETSVYFFPPKSTELDYPEPGVAQYRKVPIDPRKRTP